MDLDLVRAGDPTAATGAASITPAGTAGPAPASGPPVAAVSVPQAAPLPAEQLLALRADAEQASRTVERARLDGCSGIAPATQPANGQIDPSELCTLWDGKEMLRADAAVALAALNATYFLRFGADLCLTDGYRSYGEQVAVRRQKPGLAAVPGTSQHGWGLAVDVCGLTGYGGDVYPWLRENAPAFGWDNPDWARDGGSGPNEPWHWEYVAGQPAQPVADS
jgi:LAS superfamily LD-carboxypeptidase LdcB